MAKLNVEALKSSHVAECVRHLHSDIQFRTGPLYQPLLDKITKTAEHAFIKNCTCAHCEAVCFLHKIIPDLWALDDERLICVEIEDTHPLSADKLIMYFDIDIAVCDAINVAFELWVVNRYGHINSLDVRAAFAGAKRLQAAGRSSGIVLTPCMIPGGAV